MQAKDENNGILSQEISEQLQNNDPTLTKLTFEEINDSLVNHLYILLQKNTHCHTLDFKINRLSVEGEKKLHAINKVILKNHSAYTKEETERKKLQEERKIAEEKYESSCDYWISSQINSAIEQAATSDTICLFVDSNKHKHRICHDNSNLLPHEKTKLLSDRIQNNTKLKKLIIGSSQFVDTYSFYYEYNSYHLPEDITLAIATLLHQPQCQLSEIQLISCRFSSSLFNSSPLKKLFDGIAHNTSLTVLNLMNLFSDTYDCNSDDPTAGTYRAVPKEMAISNSIVTEHLVPALKQNKSLKTLNLQYRELKAETILQLVLVLKDNHTLTNLVLTPFHWSSKTFGGLDTIYQEKYLSRILEIIDSNQTLCHFDLIEVTDAQIKEMELNSEITLLLKQCASALERNRNVAEKQKAVKTTLPPEYKPVVSNTAFFQPAEETRAQTALPPMTSGYSRSVKK